MPICAICRWQMVAPGLQETISELVEQPGMPDAKAIRAKMKRRMQNHRSAISKALPQGYSMDMVDALIFKLTPNTPGAKMLRVQEATLLAIEDMDDDTNKDLLVRLYNDLVPTGHSTLVLDGVCDPRLDWASD